MSLKPQEPPTLHRDARRVVEEDAAWQVRLLARRIAAATDRGLAGSGLSSSQFTLLCLIAASPDDTIGGLAARAGLDQSTLSRNVEALQRRGWVEAVTAEADRRRRAVWLTEAGARHLARAMPAWQAAQDALAQRLGPDAAAALRAMVGRLK